MLENKLGITDSTELARMEEKISKQKALEMFERQTVINFRDFGQIILILKKEFMSSFLATRMR